MSIIGRGILLPSNQSAPSGKNLIHITILSPYNSTMLINLGNLYGGSGTIDWGDGTTQSLAFSMSHTYSPTSYPADYVIEIAYIKGAYPLSFPSNTFGTDSNNTRELVKKIETTDIVIGQSAFTKCHNVEDILLASSAFFAESPGINDRAFQLCSSLRSAFIPANVDSIGSYAFANCTSLNSVSIPQTVTTIRSYAFWGCYALRTIKLPKSITVIGSNAFAGCDDLEFVDLSEFDDSIPVLGTNAFTVSANNKVKFGVKNQDRLDAFSTAENWSTYASRYVIKDW